MFQSISIPSQKSIAVNPQLPVLISAGIPRRLSSIRCRATVAEDFAGCLIAARHPSLYEVLEVNQNATPVDIKKAYRQLAKIYHPDSSSEKSVDGSDFIKIHIAYETLSDPKSRDAYDRSIDVSGRRKTMTNSGASTTSFGSNTPRSYPVRSGHGFYPTRNWDSDQCW